MSDLQVLLIVAGILIGLPLCVLVLFHGGARTKLAAPEEPDPPPQSPRGDTTPPP